MKKDLHIGDEARIKILKGAEKLSTTVKATLGPKGRNVILDTPYGTPHITKDGVTVANAIALGDPLENLGAQVLKQAAAKTVAQAGDGTTTATILAYEILKQANKYILAGANPVDLKRGIEVATARVVKDLKKNSKQFAGDWDMIEKIATISANNDPALGSIIREAFEAVGTDGVVAVQESKSTSTHLEKAQGYSFDRGYISPYFVTDPNKRTTELEDVYILFYDKKIRSTQEIVPIMEKLYQAKGQGVSFLVIAEEVEAQALGLLVVNKMQMRLSLAAVKAPAFGDRRTQMLEDMAILTGGKVISESMGNTLEKVSFSDLGHAQKVTITASKTSIIGGSGDVEKIQGRISTIRSEIETADMEYNREKAKERLAKLVGGVAMIHVGAQTEVELKEKKDRLDDAIQATNAALEEGVSPGAGTSYLQAIYNTSDLGEKCVVDALKSITYGVCQNAGLPADKIIDDILQMNLEGPSHVLNANEKYERKYGDPYELGVLDPTKVLRCALENAASAASMLIMTEAAVTLQEDNNQTEIDTQPPF